jgi:hypothetical protein
MHVWARELEHSSRAFGSLGGAPMGRSRGPARSGRYRAVPDVSAPFPHCVTSPSPDCALRHPRAAQFLLTSRSLRADRRGLYLHPTTGSGKARSRRRRLVRLGWPDIAAVQLRQGGRYCCCGHACVCSARSAGCSSAARSPAENADDVRRHGSSGTQVGVLDNRRYVRSRSAFTERPGGRIVGGVIDRMPIAVVAVHLAYARVHPARWVPRVEVAVDRPRPPGGVATA